MIKNLFKYWTLQVFNPGAVIKEKYASFQSLLEKDKQAHELMAELEEIYYDQIPVDFSVIEDKYKQFSAAVGGMIADLYKISPGKYVDLSTFYKKFDDYVRFMLISEAGSADPPYAVALDHRLAMDVSLVGGKTANLARAPQATFEVVESLDGTARGEGGFGSTGVNDAADNKSEAPSE